MVDDNGDLLWLIMVDDVYDVAYCAFALVFGLFSQEVMINS